MSGVSKITRQKPYLEMSQQYAFRAKISKKKYPHNIEYSILKALISQANLYIPSNP